MLTPGDILQQRYTILGVLGQGGMGIVYIARDRRLDTQCVVKEMALAGQMSEIREYATRQFEREAKVLAALHHQHLPRVIDYFEEQDSYFLVMDFIEGESLQHAIHSKVLPEQKVLVYAVQILNVLEYIHKHGVLHRDIKPANIIIKPNGDAVLIDFGLAKLLLGMSSALTSTVLGTLEYAPPEQLNGNTDERSDIYSLGATLYHALTGSPPLDIGTRFSGRTLPDIRTLNPMVSARTAQVVHKALELNRSQRFDSAVVMRDALILDAPPPPPLPNTAVNLKRIVGVLGGIVGIAAVGVVATLLFGGGTVILTPTPTMSPAVPPQQSSAVAGAAYARTSTPDPPTATLAPTNPSVPTQTPVTPTSTPRTTATPTNTPSPTPTDTPAPTRTPTPSATPIDQCNNPPYAYSWFFSPHPTNEECLKQLRRGSSEMQSYTNGHILWIRDGQIDGKVHVFINDGAWIVHDGSIASAESAYSSRLGAAIGQRSTFASCLAHTTANGLTTAYVSLSGGRVIKWSITEDGRERRGWQFLDNTQFLGCR